MKRLSLLAALFILNCWVANAQMEGYPTVYTSTSETMTTTKKLWMVRYASSEGDGQSMVFSMSNGEHLVGETPYATMHIYERTVTPQNSILRVGTNMGNRATMYFRQEGNKVYCLPEEGAREIPVLDYGLNAGETFETHSGEKLTVEEIGTFEDILANLSISETEQPKMLRLRSEQTGKEEIWIEGMGSSVWGIAPVDILGSAGLLKEVPAVSQVFQMCDNDGRGYDALFALNETDYKVAYHEPGRACDAKDNGIRYAFSRDTLCLTGVYLPQASYGAECVECMVGEGNLLALNFSALHIITTNNTYKEINVKIPGFKAGTYFVYNGSATPEELVCDPTGDENAIRDIPDARIQMPRDISIYDLTGRRIGQPQRGLYIQNGKKRVVR